MEFSNIRDLCIPVGDKLQWLQSLASTNLDSALAMISLLETNAADVRTPLSKDLLRSLINTNMVLPNGHAIAFNQNDYGQLELSWKQGNSIVISESLRSEDGSDADLYSKLFHERLARVLSKTNGAEQKTVDDVIDELMDQTVLMNFISDVSAGASTTDFNPAMIYNKYSQKMSPAVNVMLDTMATIGSSGSKQAIFSTLQQGFAQLSEAPSGSDTDTVNPAWFESTEQLGFWAGLWKGAANNWDTAVNVLSAVTMLFSPVVGLVVNAVGKLAVGIWNRATNIPGPTIGESDDTLWCHLIDFPQPTYSAKTISSPFFTAYSYYEGVDNVRNAARFALRTNQNSKIPIASEFTVRVGGNDVTISDFVPGLFIPFTALDATAIAAGGYNSVLLWFKRCVESSNTRDDDRIDWAYDGSSTGSAHLSLIRHNIGYISALIGTCIYLGLMESKLSSYNMDDWYDVVTCYGHSISLNGVEATFEQIAKACTKFLVNLRDDVEMDGNYVLADAHAGDITVKWLANGTVVNRMMDELSVGPLQGTNYAAALQDIFYLQEEDMEGFSYVINGTVPQEWTPKYVMPEVSPTNWVYGALVKTAAVVTIAAVSVVVATKVRKTLRNLKYRRQLKMETARQDYLAHPSKETLNAYTKALARFDKTKAASGGIADLVGKFSAQDTNEANAQVMNASDFAATTLEEKVNALYSIIVGKAMT